MRAGVWIKKLAQLILFASTVPWFYACATAPVEAPVEESVEAKTFDEASFDSNRLIYHNVSLSLPIGWSFHLPFNEDPPGVMFRFRNREGTVFGSVETAEFNFAASLARIADFYSRVILNNITEKKLQETAIDGQQAYLVTGVKEQEQLDVEVAVVVSGMRIYLVEMVSRQNIPRSQKESIERIFQSFKGNQPDGETRLVKDNVSFYGYDGKWIWHGDFKGGIYLSGQIEDKNCLIGIWKVEEKSTEQLYKNQANFEIPLFEAEFFINYQKIPTKGTGYRDQEGYMKVYYVLEYAGKRYCVFFSVKKDDFSLPPEELHNNEQFRDVFRYYLSFDE